MNDFDMNTFKEEQDDNDECKADVNSNIADECLGVKRLCTALKYFSLMDIINNKQHRDIFSHFVNTVYTNILDDNTHLVQAHGNHIQNINESLLNSAIFSECDIRKCAFTARHHRVNKNGDDVDVLDPVLRFYKDIMDSLHFYLFHLYHCGLRVTKVEDGNDNDNKQDEFKTYDEYFDAGLSRLTRIIKEAEMNTAAFDRFKADDKFNIAMDKQGIFCALNSKQSYWVLYDEIDDETFVDEMIKYASNKSNAAELTKLLVEEEYDSESLRYDISYVGNILHHIEHKQLAETLQNVFSAVQSMLSLQNMFGLIQHEITQMLRSFCKFQHWPSLLLLAILCKYGSNTRRRTRDRLYE